MLADQDPDIRNQGVDKLLVLWAGSDIGDKEKRPFKVPKINLDCNSYVYLIDWDGESITETVITADMSIKELESLRHSPLEIENYPCHSQGCERAVKETSRASVKVVGWKARDGFIRLSGLSRAMMKKFNSKQDFVSNILDWHKNPLYVNCYIMSVIFCSINIHKLFINCLSLRGLKKSNVIHFISLSPGLTGHFFKRRLRYETTHTSTTHHEFNYVILKNLRELVFETHPAHNF